MAKGGRPVSPGTARRRAGEHPEGRHATRCPVPQRSAAWAPRPGVHGRRKDCLVTAPEAEPRKEACRAPVWVPAAGGSHGHRPHRWDDRRWLPGCAGRPLECRGRLRGCSTGTAGGGATVNFPPPDPGTAQSTAYNMMSSFGFNPKTEFGCLDNIWTRESGWRYNAENASGAYGIPQALPGSKMASAGADWQTNPATQIKWGLGYIKSMYGTPCDAWSFWQGHGYY